MEQEDTSTLQEALIQQTIQLQLTHPLVVRIFYNIDIFKFVSVEKQRYKHKTL